MPVLLPAEIERAERERVERKRPWLAFSRHEPAILAKPEADHFCWRSPGDAFPEIES